jgi:hypothetical protein
MQLNIKQLILEGYSYEEITEAVHANHNHLNKRNPENSKNRQELAKTIKSYRVARDEVRQDKRYPDGSRNYGAPVDPQKFENYQARANKNDNQARVVSQQGHDAALSLANEFAGLRDGHSNRGRINAPYMASAGYPRVIASAKE